jgi:hypothetical protein
MKEYQVVRNVDIVTNIKAANEEEAVELALESESAGKWMTEFQENYTEVDGINIEKIRSKAELKKPGRLYRVYAVQAQVSLIRAKSKEDAARIFMEESPYITGTNTCVMDVRISKDPEKDQHITISESADL